MSKEYFQARNLELFYKLGFLENPIYKWILKNKKGISNPAEIENNDYILLKNIFGKKYFYLAISYLICFLINLKFYNIYVGKQLKMVYYFVFSSGEENGTIKLGNFIWYLIGGYIFWIILFSFHLFHNMKKGVPGEKQVH